MREFDWKTSVVTTPKSKVASLKKNLGIGRVAAEILCRRGVTDLKKAQKHLQGSYADLYDPLLLPEMSEAVQRVLIAKNRQEKVFIHGDYDCDGITATALVKMMLENIGVNQSIAFIPTRELGYGLSTYAVKQAADSGATLIITCDCGSNEAEAHEKARKLGLDVIVLDHHSFPQRPDVTVFVNPEAGKYPFKDLCGAGVAFKLVQAMNKHYPTHPQDYIDLAAIATIADSEPILDENRIIVKEGLKRLQSTQNIGLSALLRASSLVGRKLSTEVISFIIAPKINAPGRISDPNLSLELLLTLDPGRAEELAKELVKVNRQRMDINTQIRDQAVKMVEGQFRDDCFLVLQDDSWHKGVIGIVASTMVELYHKPCAIISNGYGSVRTVPEFQLMAPLAQCSHLFERWGGHPMAAGLKIKTENVDHFRDQINKIAGATLPKNPRPQFKFDTMLSLREVNLNLVGDLEKLEPFGMGNQTPLFVMEDVHVARDRVTNDGQHLQLSLRQDKNLVSAVGFWMAGHSEQIIDPAQKFDLLFFVERSRYDSPQIMIRDLKEVSLVW